MSKNILKMWLEYILNIIIYSYLPTHVHVHLTYEITTKVQ